MTTFLVLLRGINVGGKNKVPMADLRRCLESRGFQDVSTYIASGNVILTSDLTAPEVTARIEDALPGEFTLDSELVKVLALTPAELQAVVTGKPDGFGDHPDRFHSDAIFLMGITAAEVMPVFNPRDGVDRVWPGTGVVYSERLSAQRTKSRLSAIVASPLYKSMTIRSWNTTLKLSDLVLARESQEQA